MASLRGNGGGSRRLVVEGLPRNVTEAAIRTAINQHVSGASSAEFEVQINYTR